MPMRFWASALAGVAACWLAGCAQAQPAAMSVPAGKRHIIDVPVPGKRTVRIPVAIDPALIAPGGRHVVTPVGPARGRYLLILDTYASRPQGLSRCQAGQERWARLIDLGATREIYHRLMESCLTNVEPGDPPARWDADGRGVTLDLLSSAPVDARIGPNGMVTEVRAK